MEKPKCRLCNEKHWQRDGCAINKPQPAINRPKIDVEKVVAAINAAPPMPVVVEQMLVLGKTPNRRERGVYNAYMREYMRKRREKLQVPRS